MISSALLFWTQLLPQIVCVTPILKFPLKIGVIFYSPLGHFSVMRGSAGDTDFNIQRFYLNPLMSFHLSSVLTGSSPEEPVEKPPEGLQPDGAAGGQ